MSQPAGTSDPTTTAAGRSLRRARLRASIFLLVAVLAGVAAVVLLKSYLDRMRGGPLPALDTRPVVVAAAALPMATAIEASHLKLVEWPAASMPTGSFSSTQMVVGRTLRAAVVKGEPILSSRLADKGAGQGLAATLSSGTRAMAVKVDQVIGVAGFVQPGDFVDVITTMRPDEEGEQQHGGRRVAKVSKVILQHIRVLAVGEQLVSQGARPQKVQVVTLEVSASQSERLALASRHGDIQLTIRSVADVEEVPTGGITPVALLCPDPGARTPGGLSRAECRRLSGEGPETPPVVVAAASGRRRAPLPRVAATRPPVQSGPVVEILRGDRIEERKLRPSPDNRPPAE